MKFGNSQHLNHKFLDLGEGYFDPGLGLLSDKIQNLKTWDLKLWSIHCINSLILVPEVAFGKGPTIQRKNLQV